ncbi:hypothetical protein [Shewanella livingstonensis]|uniref:Uncharacterized protein n=1 Tax=Shewanella livingstonensis TaxID=150120 RepID=A0A3G8LYM7_9GAMM|nr:hypothetical protein [Shewanella livingstonensis]AZG74786.1 hypothetical protein EGC82_19735 [Shewanella livingstonensis]
MKILSFLFFILITSSSQVLADEYLDFGMNVLSDKFTAFEVKHDKCLSISKMNQLSENSIDILKQLPISAGEALGYLHLKAMRLCVGDEYTALLQVLLDLEYENKKNQNTFVSQEIDKIKLLIFSVSELKAQKKFDSLPAGYRSKLQSVEGINKPFDMTNAFERAWL